MSVTIIGIAGGSCSGKTTFSRRAKEKLGLDNCSVLFQDNYYIDQSHRFDEDGGSVNFDHPNSLDFPLMAKHLSMLKKGESVEVPLYDFATHTRKPESLQFSPKKIVLVDGILLLSQKSLVEIFDTSIFIECDPEIRFQRRLDRDVAERGRTPEGVKAQFDKQVEPMHQEFVESSKTRAALVISQEEYLNNMDDYINKLAQQYL